MKSSRRRSLAALALVGTLGQTGCWHFMFGARGYAARPVEAPLDRKAILRVDEAGLFWGNGDFGSELHKALVSAGLFERLYYPIEPPDPPPLVVEIEAVGNLDEAILWAILASAATGYFFFMPAPVMPYFQDFGVSCDVRILRGSVLLHQFEVETEANVVHAIFADPETYVTNAKVRVFEDISQRIVDGVAATRVPLEPEPL